MAIVAELSNVEVRRGTATLLSGINWRIDDPDRWVLLGPNGAGKTTLLGLLSAHLHPSSGTVQLLGETLGSVDVFELRPRIGLASSAIGARIPGHELVRDVVVSAAYGVLGRWREAYGAADYARAEQLLVDLRMGGLMDRTYGTLSEGERKRAEIARALMTDPELLLLDEPFAGLDLAGRESLIAVLAEMYEDPKAPPQVLVTHHLEEIPHGVTHALLLNQGRIVARGALDETLTDQCVSDAFRTPLHVTYTQGRWGAFGVPNIIPGPLPLGR